MKSNPAAATSRRHDARSPTSTSSASTAASKTASPPLPTHKASSSGFSAAVEQVVELRRANYADVIENPLGGKVWRTVLLVMSPNCQTNTQPFVRMLNHLAMRYSRSCQLRFAYVLLSTASTRQWYANLLENAPTDGNLSNSATEIESEDDSSLSSAASASSSSSASFDRDYEKIEGDEATPAGAHLTKLMHHTYSLVAFNYARSYFVVFYPVVTKKANNKKHKTTQVPVSSNSNLMCNWLERFAEGSSQHKCYVKQWPRFG